jgi:hypothetical protein
VAVKEPVLAAVARRLREAPDEVLPTLRLLADPDALPERSDDHVVAVARRVNAHRLQEHLARFREGALSTAEVREALGGVTRQAVAGRVASGSLLSLEIAGRSWFPSWQFGPEGVLPGLVRVLQALVEDGRGALAADALARAPLTEERGASVADLLAAGRVDDAVHYVRTAAAG